MVKSAGKTTKGRKVRVGTPLPREPRVPPLLGRARIGLARNQVDGIDGVVVKRRTDRLQKKMVRQTRMDRRDKKLRMMRRV